MSQLPFEVGIPPHWIMVMTWRATCGSKHVIAVYYWGTKIHSPTILGYQRYRGFDAYPQYLVVSNIFYFSFHIWDVILPIGELIFFKMVKTTNQIFYMMKIA